MLDPDVVAPRDAQTPSANVRDLLAESNIAFRRCYLALLSAAACDWKGGDALPYVQFAVQALEPALIPAELRDAADRLRSDLDFIRDFHEGGATSEARTLGIGALTRALTATALSR
ncbi:MAG: hypothetical protein JWM86_1538 [Thermoleophilia bacterium]|nr:hypothetical protein [Thermoleophilia bacterium]